MAKKARTKPAKKAQITAKPRGKSAKGSELALRNFALTYPETHEDFPWGERALKVKGKVFVFMGTGETKFSIGVKLPQSSGLALSLPFAEPTHYGLGKHGWITASFGKSAKIPVDLLKQWIDESYRAVAPKKLVKQLDE